MKVQTLKITALWFEPLPLRLDGKGRPAAHQEALARAFREDGEFTPPWRSDSVSSFWRYYLEQNPPSSVTPWEAWDRLVPLRRGEEIRGRNGGPVVDGTAFAGDLQIESFHYPHGVGLAVSVRIEEDRELADMVDRAREVMKEAIFRVSWNPRPVSLPAIASHFLDKLAGRERETSVPDRTDSFTVATIFRGDSGALSDGKPADELRLALQGLCTFRRGWRDENLPGRKCQLRLRTEAGPENLLFGLGRGRAVWFPGAFTSNDSKNRTLGCYHRNLVLASLQTESLIQAAQLAAHMLQTAPPPLSVRLEEVSRRAVQWLGALHSGDDTYASWSVVAQIERDRAILETVREVRDYFGMPRMRRNPREGDDARPVAPPPSAPSQAAATAS